MDEREAESVAVSVLDEWRDVRFAELAQLVDHSLWTDRTGPSGAVYAVKVYALWDGGVVDGELRVVADAMDGTKTRLGTLRGTGSSFIVTPAGQIL